MITIEIDDAEVRSSLSRLAAKVADFKPALREIGEALVETTKQRFSTSTGPDGQRWDANAQVTMLAYLQGKSGAFGKRDGKITGKGAAYAMNKKPLVATGGLRDSFRYQVEGNALLVGTNWMASDIKSGAAIHQFGGQAGRGKKVTIPARPFLGISADDRGLIERTILSYLADSDRSA